MSQLCTDRRIVAPDMMGNGDSDPPPMPQTDMAFYRDCLIALMDKFGIACADFYGSHTGAQIVLEFAIAQPRRVGRLVLDGITLFPDTIRTEFLTQYAPAMVPKSDGSHLAWVWSFIQNMAAYFPHYKPDAEHATGGAISPPDAATTPAADVLKVWSTFHIAYGAAFRHPVRERLALLRVPTLVLETEGDPLARYAEEAAMLIGQERKAVAATRASTGETIRAILRDIEKSNGTGSGSSHEHQPPPRTDLSGRRHKFDGVIGVCGCRSVFPSHGPVADIFENARHARWPPRHRLSQRPVAQHGRAAATYAWIRRGALWYRLCE